MKMNKLLPLALLPVLLFSACTTQDYYSQVIGDCNYLQAPGTYSINLTAAGAPAAQLQPKCKAALEAILPYDATWATAPDGAKDKVTEAFQAILAYNLKLPAQNTILNVAPYSIPLWHLSLFQSEETPQKSIFNHIINLVQTITYNDSVGPNFTAQYTPKADLGGLLTITKLFSSQDGYYTGSFTRAATIIHEARHGDGYFHSKCPPDVADGIYECDTDQAGPYGMEVTYYEMLLQANGNRISAAKPSPLSDVDVNYIGFGICANLFYMIRQAPAPLATLVTTSNCVSQNAAWFINQEGLNR